MTETIRPSLKPALGHGAGVSNAGLELDCYLTGIGDDNKAADALNKRIGADGVPEIYEQAYRRWWATLERMRSSDNNIATIELKVAGRMIVGIGAESVREASVSLMRAYGVPYIPGSALKGLARHYAETAIAGDDKSNALAAPDPKHSREQNEASKNAHFRLFGDTTSAAYIDYFDAWFIPDRDKTTNELNGSLRPDVITVHHQDYYGKRGGNPNGPWDFDDPNPNPFLSAAGRFLIAVRGPNQAWAGFALCLLTQALGDWGVGAKTSSGYGRLTVDGRLPELTATKPESVPAVAVVHPAVAEIANMRERNAVKSEIGTIAAQQWLEIQDENDRRIVALAIVECLQSSTELNDWGKKRTWLPPVEDWLKAHPGRNEAAS